MCGYSFGPHQVYGTKSQEGSIDRKAGTDAANGSNKGQLLYKGWKKAKMAVSMEHSFSSPGTGGSFSSLIIGAENKGTIDWM